MIKTINFFKFSALTACAALITLGCVSATVRQNAQTMNNQPNRNANSAPPTGGQAAPSAMNSNSFAATDGLAKYKDKKIDSLPTKAVSPKYIVEHRTALNDRIVTVSGVIVSVSQSPADNSAMSGARSMANPQPRIFIADTAKDSRDKNRDVMVIVEEGNNYSVGQKVNFKVKVSSSKVAVMLQKVL